MGSRLVSERWGRRGRKGSRIQGNGGLVKVSIYE